MEIALYILAGWNCFGGLALCSQVGKQRKPITGGQAAFILAIVATEVVLLVLAARKIG